MRGSKLNKQERLVQKWITAILEDNWQGTTPDAMQFLGVKARQDMQAIKRDVVKSLASGYGTYFAYDYRSSDLWPYGRFRNGRSRATIESLLRQNIDRAVSRLGDISSGVNAAALSGYLKPGTAIPNIKLLTDLAKQLGLVPDGLEWIIVPPDEDDDGVAGVPSEV
jgi:hypothetical protein